MNEKLPYYMAYPTPFEYEDERCDRMDFEYLKSMYPEVPKRLLPYVEEECDRMEYERSMIYDAYPDRLQMRLMCARICENIRKNERLLWSDPEQEPKQKAADGSFEGQESCGSCGRVSYKKMPDRGDTWLHDLVEVMLYQELYRRRCGHRRRCRRFY